MTGIPQAAIDAGKDAFAQVYNDPATMTACIVAAVEAAAPAIAAVERERITGLFDEWIAVCLAEPNHHPVDAWRAGFRSLLDIDHPGKIAAHPDSLTDPALD